MNLRTLIVVGALGLLGFLLFPRGGPEVAIPGEDTWIATVRPMPNEPLRALPMYKTEPVVQTFDLGFIYQIDRVRLLFKDSANRGPRRYTILGSPRRNGTYTPVFSYHGYSSQYRQGVRPLPEPAETRWLQVVIEDWANQPPEMLVKEFRVGARYELPGPITAVHANINKAEARLLIDGLMDEPWYGAVRKSEVKEGEPPYEPPPAGEEIWLKLDLGSTRQVSEVRVHSKNAATHPQNYTLSFSVPDRYEPVRATVTPPADSPISSYVGTAEARFIQMNIPAGAWSGDWVELVEVEVFTDQYRRLPEGLPAIEEHNAVQAYYENCGYQNQFSPNLVQGFAYEREDTEETPERYLWRADQIESTASEAERSFAYHPQELIFRYDRLDPTALYWIRLTYLQPKDGKRVQRLKIGPYVAHGSTRPDADQADLWTPGKGTPEALTFAIPPDTYRDGNLDIRIQRLRGPNAVVSELFLFEARPVAAREPAALSASSYAPRAITPPTVDGDLSEWPRLYPLEIPTAGSRLYLQWDPQRLYLACEVDRARIDPRTDQLHLFIDTAYTRSPGMYTPSDHHFVLSRLLTPGQIRVSQIHHHMDAISASILDLPEVQMVARMSPDRYVLEAALPVDTVLHGFSPSAGSSIGFNYAFGTESDTWAQVDRAAPPARWGRVQLTSPTEGVFTVYDATTHVAVQSFSAGDTLLLSLTDPDRNQDPLRSEQIQVEIVGDLTGSQRTLTLQETTLDLLLDADPGNDRATDSEFFAARLVTRYGTTPVADSDVPLAVQGHETVTLSYRDPYASATDGAKQINAQLRVLTGATGSLDLRGETGELLPTASGSPTGATGSLSLVDDAGNPIRTFRAGDLLTLVVIDTDLVPERQGEGETEGQGDKETSITNPQPATRNPQQAKPKSQISIEVVVEPTEEHESVILEYVADQRAYQGHLPTSYAESVTPEDGVLQVAGAQQAIATYVDRIQETGRTNAPVRKRALVLTGETATLSILPTPNMVLREGESYFNAGESLTVRLEDRDLDLDPAQPDRSRLDVEGGTNGDRLPVDLLETSPHSGLFLGAFPTQYALAASEDEQLQVVGSELVTLTYLDALQGTGETDVPVQVTVRVNTGADGTLSIVHTDLTDIETFNAGDTLYFTVADEDLTQRDIMIEVAGDLLGDRAEVALLRSAVGTYTAPLITRYAEVKDPEDALLQVHGGETITATYVDALRESGESGVAVYDQAIANVGTTGTLSVFREGESTAGLQFAAGETLRLLVADADLNANSSKIETVNVLAQFHPTGNPNDIARERLLLTLQEQSGNAGIFEAQLPTDYSETVDSTDDALQVQGYGSVAFTYTDAIQETGRTQVPIKVVLGVATGQTGQLQLRKADDSGPLASLNAGARILVQLTDNDLNRSPTIKETASVIATGNVFQDRVDLLLQETDVDSGKFRAYLETADVTRDPDSVDYRDQVLQVRDKEVVEVLYRDALTSLGQPDQPIQVRALVASSSAGILLIVNEAGREIGEFMAGEPLTVRLEDLSLTTALQVEEVWVELSGNLTNDYLQVRLEALPGASGLFEGIIATRYGTAPTYDDVLDVQGGETVQATYTPDFLGIPGLQVTDRALVSRGTRGRLEITRSDGTLLRHFAPGTTLHFRVQDPDIDRDPFAIEETDILVGTEAAGVLRQVTLQEIAPDAGIFAGSLATLFGQSNEALGLSGGEMVTATYTDALVETGETRVPILATCAVNQVGYASYATETLVVDGLNNRWNLNDPMSTENGEALVWVQWDSENLYLFAQIEDTEVVVPDPTRWYENADALEIHLDLTGQEQGRPSYVPRAVEPFVFWFCPIGAGPDGGRPYAGLAAPTLVWNYAPPIEIARRFRPEQGYYLMEIAIPFRVLGGFDPRNSTRYRIIGFNYIVYRSDGPQLQWSQARDLEDQTTPSQLGTLYFRLPE